MSRKHFVESILVAIAVLALALGVVYLAQPRDDRNVFCNISGSIGS